MNIRHHRLLLMLAIVVLMSLPVMVQAAKVQPPQAGKSPTIDKIRNQGVLKAGVTILAPWLLQNPSSGKYIGPAAIVAKSVANELGVKLNYIDATWDTIVAGLVSNKYELADAALFETPARKKVIGFATYDHSGTCYVVSPDSDIHHLKDLNNPDKVYLGYTGYATDALFQDKYPKTKVHQISPPPGSGPRVPALLAGRGDIVPIDSPLVYWVHKKWPKLRLIPPVKKCFKHPDLVRKIGVGYPKDDPAFGAFLKNVIKAHQQEINAAKKRFSQPQWLNKH